MKQERIISTAEGDFKAVASMSEDGGEKVEIEAMGDSDPRVIPYIEPYVKQLFFPDDIDKLQKAEFMLEHVGEHQYFPLDFIQYPENAII